MSVQEAIIKAQAALDKLKDGSYQILTKVIPATWGQLQIWLTSELQRIKTEGGITVNPPEVVLPDGVQSTSQVTQSEMAQFVTNTLNTWLAGLAPTGDGYPLSSFLYPEARKLSSIDQPGYNGYIIDTGELTTKFYSNYESFCKLLFDPDNNGYAPLNFYDGHTGAGSANSYKNYAGPIPILPGTTDGTYNYIMTARFVTDSLEDDYSNIATVFQRDRIECWGCYMSFPIKDDASNVGRVFRIYWRRSEHGNQYVGAKKILISYEIIRITDTSYATMYPLLEISQDEAWFRTAQYETNLEIPVYFRFPKYSLT